MPSSFCSRACATQPTVRAIAKRARAEPRGRFKLRRRLTRATSQVGNCPAVSFMTCNSSSRSALGGRCGSKPLALGSPPDKADGESQELFHLAGDVDRSLAQHPHTAPSHRKAIRQGWSFHRARAHSGRTVRRSDKHRGRACGRNDAYGKCRGIEFMVGLQNEGATDKICAYTVRLPGISKKQVNWLLVRLT